MTKNQRQPDEITEDNIMSTAPVVARALEDLLREALQRWQQSQRQRNIAPRFCGDGEMTMPENQYCPDYTSHPGETLLDILLERRLTAARLAEMSGLGASAIADLIGGVAPITRTIARALEKALGPSVQFWLNRQRQYDTVLRDQARADAVLDEIIKYKRANDGIAPSVRELVALCDLPGVGSVSQLLPLLARLEMQDKIMRLPKGATRNIQVVGGAWVFDDEDEGG